MRAAPQSRGRRRFCALEVTRNLIVSAATLNMDPLIKRILADPQAPGIPSSGLRLAAMLGFTMYVGAVLYSKHVAPLAIQDRIKKEMFPPSSSSSSSAHH